MAKIGIGVYSECDAGWSNCLWKMFKNTGVSEANCAIAKVRFVVMPKEATHEVTQHKCTVDRLRYQLHTEAFKRGSDQKLATLLNCGDELHIVWNGHGQSAYSVEEDENGNEIKTYTSVKFAPSFNTKGPDEMLSAKQLAAVIFRFCQTSNSDLVYPRSLTIASCRSGEARAGERQGDRDRVEA